MKTKLENMFKTIGKTALKAALPVIAAIAFLMPKEAEAQSYTLSGFVRDAANGISSDSALVTIINPSNNSITTKVGRVLDDYWNRTTPNGFFNNGDTAKIYVQDTIGQQANTFHIVKATGNYVSTLFCGGHAYLIPSVWDTVDSINVKCYSKGPTVWSDTLQGRFRRGIPHDDVYFNREKFSRKPALNDSIVFEITEGSYGARTALKYQRALWDADTAVSCSLGIVGINENQLEKQVKETGKLIITPNPSRGMIVLPYQFKGFLYDASGRKIMDINNEKLDLRDYSNGIYFVSDIDNKQRGKLILLK